MGKVSEGFWRFLAAVMLFAVCWSLWILYQLNPPVVVTRAAFEAAAKARATQSAKGIIQPATVPVDTAKLKLTESLAAPPIENR